MRIRATVPTGTLPLRGSYRSWSAASARAISSRAATTASVGMAICSDSSSPRARAVCAAGWVSVGGAGGGGPPEGCPGGQLLADLDVGIRTVLDAAEQLDDEALPIRNRRIALLRGEPLRGQRPFAAQLLKGGGPPR